MDKRILVVEDDELFAKILSKRLSGAGFEVKHVKDGSKALDHLDRHTYSLILTDLMMPILDGFDFLKELQIRGSKIPVFVFSQLSQPKDEMEVMELGAKEMLTKDTPVDAIIVLIKKYLK